MTDSPFIDAIELEQQKRHTFMKSLAQTPPEHVAAAVDSVPFLTPAERDAFKRRAEEMMEEDTAMVTQWLEREYDEFTAKADRAEEAAEEVAGEVKDLIAAAEKGQVPAADFQKRFRELEHRTHALQGGVDRLKGQPERFQTLEDDPTAYMRSLGRKYPIISRLMGGSPPVRR